MPLAFWPLFTGFNFVHSMWSTHQRLNVWKPKNFLSLSQGLTLQATVGRFKVIRVMAQAAEAAPILIKCSHDVRRIKENWFRLNQLFRNTDKIPMKIDWVKISKRPLLSASTHLYLEEKRLIIRERSKRVAICSCLLLTDSFLLSMHTKDFHKALEGHTFQVAEMAYNIQDLIKKILIHADVVDEILEEFDIPWKVKDFIETTGIEIPESKASLPDNGEFFLEKAPKLPPLDRSRKGDNAYYKDFQRTPKERTMVGADTIGTNGGVKSMILSVIKKKPDEKPPNVINQITIKKSPTPL